jgi:hypothetical protein
MPLVAEERLWVLFQDQPEHQVHLQHQVSRLVALLPVLHRW